MSDHAEVALATDRFDADLAMLTEELGFRVEMIRPADAPTVAVVSGHGLWLRLERSARPATIAITVVTDEFVAPRRLPGGTTIDVRPRTRPVVVPDNRPELVIGTRQGAAAGEGRAGMRYRDLLPGGWGRRFESSLISIPDGGPVPDYVHFHRIRFQMIFVKAGWVRVVYEDQGEPFVLHAGDCVLQPPEIRHRVLEASPGLEVVEIGCPAEHDTLADWSLELPTPQLRPDRDFGGQRFVRHVAADASYSPWRHAGWEARDTDVGAATNGLAGARVARPTPAAAGTATTVDRCRHEAEFAQLVVLAGRVTFDADGADPVTLVDGDGVAIPGALGYRLLDPSTDCELLDVTLPAEVACRR